MYHPNRSYSNFKLPFKLALDGTIYNNKTSAIVGFITNDEIKHKALKMRGFIQMKFISKYLY